MQPNEQQRNILGQTAYPMEGLEKVKGLTPKHTALIERLNLATLGDTKEARLNYELHLRKLRIQKAKESGLIDPTTPIEHYSLKPDGTPQLEII
jgi:hypothetical protein